MILQTFEKEEVFVIYISKNIKEKKELMSFYSEVLDFPEYFSENWDSLSDILTDLSWVQPNKLLIIDCSTLEGQDRKIHDEILQEVSRLDFIEVQCLRSF